MMDNLNKPDSLNKPDHFSAGDIVRFNFEPYDGAVETGMRPYLIVAIGGDSNDSNTQSLILCSISFDEKYFRSGYLIDVGFPYNRQGVVLTWNINTYTYVKCDSKRIEYLGCLPGRDIVDIAGILRFYIESGRSEHSTK